MSAVSSFVDKSFAGNSLYLRGLGLYKLWAKKRNISVVHCTGNFSLNNIWYVIWLHLSEICFVLSDELWISNDWHRSNYLYHWFCRQKSFFTTIHILYLVKGLVEFCLSIWYLNVRIMHHFQNYEWMFLRWKLQVYAVWQLIKYQFFEPNLFHSK